MIVNMKDKAKDLYYDNKKSGLNSTNPQDAIDEVSSKVDQIAGNQIPEEYLESAVDEYVKNNSAGFATQVNLEELDSQLSGEIANVEKVKLSKLSVFKNFAYSGLINPQRAERTDRITNDTPIEFLENVIITPNSGYKMLVWEVRGDNLKVLPLYSDGAMKTDACNISKNTKVYITIMTSSSTTISPSIIDNCVTVLNANTSELLNYNDYFSTSVDNKNVLYPSFSYENITFSNKAWVSAENAFVSRDDIITTNEVIYSESNTIITPNSGYEMIILYTDENGTDIQSFTEWLNSSIEIDKGTYYYIEFRSATVSGVVRADIVPSEGVFCANIIVSSMEERLHNVEEKVDNIVENNSINVIATKDIVEDFFIKRTDTSGRILNVTNPYEKKYGNQYMGQLHCHTWTYGSTTEHTRENVENLYNMYDELGYDFMTVTNYPYHDDLTPNPYPNGNIVWLCNAYEQAITPPTLDEKNQNTHLVCLNAKNVYAPEYVTDKYINDVLEDLVADDVTTVLAHPMWCAGAEYDQSSVHQTLYFKEQLLNLVDKFKFVEIFNSLSISNNSDSPYINNTAYALDVLASDGRKVFGFAVSDSHVFSGTADYTMYGGNIKVFAKEKTQLAIWDSIMKGNFYSCDSIYASLKSVDLIDNVLTIDIGASATTKFYGKDGVLLSTVEGNVASYAIKGTEMYVRAEITLADGKRMWTNPIYLG